MSELTEKKAEIMARVEAVRAKVVAMELENPDDPALTIIAELCDISSDMIEFLKPHLSPPRSG